MNKNIRNTFRANNKIRGFHCYTTNDNNIINEFWDQFYEDLVNKIPYVVQEHRYNTLVFNKLREYKENHICEKWNESDLIELQKGIEDITRRFDENTIFSETPNLIKLLIRKDLINAKYYLRKEMNDELYNSTIAMFGEYTIEAILIYALAVSFHSIQENLVVRLSTLLGLIDRLVITQVNIINKNNQKISSKDGDISSKKGKGFEIGRKLIDFMIERELIAIESISADDNKPVVKKKGKAYIERNLFVVCNFDLSILPLKLNLPMVCKPVDWQHPSEYDELHQIFDWEIEKPFMLSDLRGGYLSSPSLNIHCGLLSSHNLNNFNIELNDFNYKEMCSILNGLQKQGFKINKKVLEFIKKNHPTLVKMGLLMPGILARVNMKEAFDLLRKSFYQNKTIGETCRLDELLKEFSIRVQRARYEDFIIKLASAYEDYVFYLPAFMDFRGRIYRSGILHFHERDLSRSLIVFANNLQEEEGCKESVKDIVATSAAFKYKKFYLYDEALQWYKENLSLIYASDESLISFAKDASEPFQFLAKVLCDDVVQEYNKIPITQDASASAYQIMSYLLLNEEMAMRTNLIPHPDGKIQDVYTYLLQDFKEYIHHRINDKEKMEIIESKLDRKLIKLIFMPLIYGKTLISIEKDISITYGQLLSTKDTFNLAKLSSAFWIHKYPDIVNLMKLIHIVSWFCSAKDRAILYSIPFFTTKQDYMAFKKESISVYERSTKKRRKVTLNIATTIRDKRKTQSATCANFIHQKDAYIAMKVVQSLLNQHVDIYTVHDNFITTPPYVKVVPDIYVKVFINMGHPLKIINHFINQNLISPEKENCIVDESIPLTSDFLKDFFNSIDPAKDKKKWSSVVSNFINCYTNYVDSVCGNQVNEVKWNQFKKLLENRNNNYSVHY